MKSPELRASFEAAMVAEIADFGSEGVRRAEIARHFQSLGMDRSTAFRWIARRIEAERSAKRLRRLGRRSATRRRVKAAAEAGGAAVGNAAVGNGAAVREAEGSAGAAATAAASARGSITPPTVSMFELSLLGWLTNLMGALEAGSRHAQAVAGRARDPTPPLAASGAMATGFDARSEMAPMARRLDQLEAGLAARIGTIPPVSPAAAQEGLAPAEAVAPGQAKMPE